MQGIKAQVAEKEYQRMVSSINGPTDSVATHLRQDIQDMKDVKAHAIGIVNVLYTGAAVFTAVFMISKHFTDDLGKVKKQGRRVKIAHVEPTIDQEVIVLFLRTKI